TCAYRAVGLRTDRAYGSPWATAYPRSTVRLHPRAVRAHHTVCHSLLTSFLRSVGRSRTLRLSRARKPQRRRSVGCKASAAAGCSARSAPRCTPCFTFHDTNPLPYTCLFDHLVRLKQEH